MARFERLEPRADDMPVFDGSMDDEDGEEGSRLPLLIVIALLVLFAFAGVVYYAYTEGVERGRADAPREIVAQNPSDAKLKVYQQPAPADDGSTDADSVPPPPSPIVQTPTVRPAPDAQSTNPAAVPDSTQKPATPPPAEIPSPATAEVAAPKKVVAAPAPEPLRVATHSPAQLAPPVETETATPPSPKVPATTEPAKPAASGSYLLQIGSYKSQDEAETAWHAFQGKHPSVGGYQSDIKQVDLGDKGTWYRLRIGTFADKDAATSLCTKLKSDGASCFMAK